VSSRVRFVTAASLIAFGALIAVGVPALLPSAGLQPLVAIADASRSALPWIGGSRTKPAVEPARSSAVEAAPPPSSPAQPPLRESRLATAAPADVVLRGPAREQAPQPAPAPVVSAPEKPVAQPEPQRQTSLVVPAPETPVQRPAAVPPRAAVQPATPPVRERRVAARPTAETPAEVAAPKKTARRDRPAKRPTSEALNTVRKFDDNLQGIPVNSYAANGSPKRIVIRPTSIQDVYYYSARPQ
jgi:hypothetical protein